MVQNPATSSAETAKEIQSLLAQLRKSRQKSLRHGSEVDRELDRSDALTLDKLRRIFARLVEDGEVSFDVAATAGSADDKASATAKWAAWLTTQHDQFTSHLIKYVLDDKSYALRTFCGVIASCPNGILGLDSNSNQSTNAKASSGNTKTQMLSERLLNKLLESVLKSRKCFTSSSLSSAQDRSSEESMLALFDSELVRPYRDVQYFVFKGVQRLAEDLLTGLEREESKRKDLGVARKSDKKRSGQDNPSEQDKVPTESEKHVEIVAENMCRLLLKMDYIAKSQNDLMEDSLFLFPPPVLGDEESLREEEQNNEDDDEDPEASDSESSDDEDQSQEKGKRQTSSDQTASSSFIKRNKKSNLVSWQQAYKHRNALQEAWLAVLRLTVPSRTTKLVLQHLSTYVLGVCPTPLRFAEYFTRCFRSGTMVTNNSASTNSNNNGLTAILSLHGLFLLILNHQLEYPQFYPSLYKLLHPRILYTKHRTRFLRLLSKSLLSNSMLPAYVVAAFCKKLLRLGVAGPPSGALFVLALVSNLLRKHGEVGCLIHRKGDLESGMMEDVFVEDADDLIETRALESSLWELTALSKHYHPAVSALAASCGTEDDKTPMYDMEDFMEHTYKSLFEHEKKRIVAGGVDSAAAAEDEGGKKKKKARVSLTFVEPKGLFCEGDVFGDAFKSF
ncbi:hypothetical protein HJC23_009237 [Cyclotella cryptica]|uniref:CCAAT-binding factor domain-containing protein n=1 Tax=Cyclotella cryptica TaxID=29204 RepID=A0ABD3Q6L1_9STRA|eukprot:CCRYP_008489-RA/>CCRYP_008489-RA protein AED:0.02 eAED:0.02 QI:200/1/1/1/1/1/2/47/674